MLAENHVMQVLYIKNFHSMIKSCYARSFIRKMYIKSCYGKFFGTNINIMLWVYHVRRGLAVIDSISPMTHKYYKFSFNQTNNLYVCMVPRMNNFD